MQSLVKFEELTKMEFFKVYREEMLISRNESPEIYAWPFSEFDTIFAKMAFAIFKGHAHKDSVAIKRTCHRLGIKHTYSAIAQALK